MNKHKVLVFALIASAQSGVSWGQGMRHFSHQGLSGVKTATAITNTTHFVAPSHAIATRFGAVHGFSHAFVAPSGVAIKPVVVKKFSHVVVTPSRVVIVKPVRVHRVVFIASPMVIASPVYYSPPVYYAPPMYSAPSTYSPDYGSTPSYSSPPSYADSESNYAEQPPSSGQGIEYRYFCPDTKLYYPEASECPSGWMKVVPDSGEIPR